MAPDIGSILREWPFGEGGNVRVIRGDDGREKVQVRVCIESYHGILQFESDGRPDGTRPHGKEFLLDHVEEKKRAAEAAGRAPFLVSRPACKALFDESFMTYQRYVVLLQLGDHARVIRDTERNMRLFRFVHENAEHPDDRQRLEQWWPYILRIHHTARALQAAGRKDLDGALSALRECRERMAGLEEVDNDTFRSEMKRSKEALDSLEKEIRGRRPITELERLEQAKRTAIDEERYEDAARIRDRIQALGEGEKGTAGAETGR